MKHTHVLQVLNYAWILLDLRMLQAVAKQRSSIRSCTWSKIYTLTCLGQQHSLLDPMQPGIAAFFAKTHKRPCKAAQQGTRLSGGKRKDRQDVADVLLIHWGVGKPVLISCSCRSADADDSNKHKGGMPCRKSFTQMHLDAGQVCPAYEHKRMWFLAAPQWMPLQKEALKTVVASQQAAVQPPSAFTHRPAGRSDLLTSLALHLQAEFSMTTCKGCGMVYSPGQPADEMQHAQFHKSLTTGIRCQVPAIISCFDAACSITQRQGAWPTVAAACNPTSGVTAGPADCTVSTPA